MSKQNEHSDIEGSLMDSVGQTIVKNHTFMTNIVQSVIIDIDELSNIMSSSVIPPDVTEN